MKLEDVIREKAKGNQQIGAEMTNTLLTNSSKAVEPINTCEELAKAAGVSEDTISRIKSIEAKASHRRVYKGLNSLG